MARKNSRNVREFRPTIGGVNPAWRLEERVLLSRAAVRAALRAAAIASMGKVHTQSNINNDGVPKTPTTYVQTGVINGGLGAIMIDTDGEIYVAHLQGGGTVRAKAVKGGQVDLFLYGTNNTSQLTIDPTMPTLGKQTAHQFPVGSVTHDNLLHIRNITVTNGRMSQILGYQTADITGAIKVLGPNSDTVNPTVDRIAFYAFKPGSSIQVVGDLNTLNVFSTLTMTTGPGIRIGRDLNWFTVGATATFENGASMLVNRDIGLAPQGRKGSSIGGAGGLIQGDLVVGPGSTIAVGRFVDAPIVVQGSSFGISNLSTNVHAATVVFGTRG